MWSVCFVHLERRPLPREGSIDLRTCGALVLDSFRVSGTGFAEPLLMSSRRGTRWHVSLLSLLALLADGCSSKAPRAAGGSRWSARLR